MAINKNFVVKNGLEVSTELIFADADTRRVGILNTQPQHSLHVVGGIGATNLTVSGVSTFSKPVGFGSDVDITGISTITGHVSIGKTTLLVVGDLDVTGNIKGGGVLDNVTNLNVSGIGTINTLYAGDGAINVGFLTVTGDANLTGITTITNLQAGLATEFFAATGIQSGGVPIGGGVTTINFTGIGATLVEVDGTIANVYISGGPGISSVGIETSGAFVGTATTLNFIGPGVTVGVTSDNVAHVSVGFGSLGYTHRSFVNIGSLQDSFAFQYNRNAIEVYLNGTKLIQGLDYTATNGTSVSLGTSALPGDTVELVSYQAEVVNPVPGQVLRRQFTANAGQVNFQFVGGYDIGNLDVYLNGSKLVESSDFTATNGTSFTLTNAAEAGDVLEGITYPANIVGAGGSNFLFMDDDVVIGLASTINFGYGIGVTGFDPSVGIVTVGIPTNLNVPGTLTVGTFSFQDLDVPGNGVIGGGLTASRFNGGSLTITGDGTFGGILTATQNYTYPGGTVQTYQNRFEQYVSPVDFGAVGDGSTDDTAALQSALDTGKPVIGIGRTYLVTSDITCDNLTSLSDCTIIRQNMASSSGATMLKIRNGNFTLDNVTFNTGTEVLRPLQTGPNAGLNSYFAVDVNTGSSSSRLSNFVIKNCKFTGNGSGTFLRTVYCDHFHIDNCFIFDNQSRSDTATDDQCQGFSPLSSTNFTLSNCNVKSMLTYNTTTSTYVNDETRAFAIGNCTDYTIIASHCEQVGQGFDVTGSGSNQRFIINACTADTCSSIGFKVANGGAQGIINSCVARRVGLYSYTISTGTDLTDHDEARFITISNCKAIDNGFVSAKDWAALGNQTRAFAVLSSNANTDVAKLPLRCSFNNCEVYNPNSSTGVAFYSDVTIPVISTIDGNSTGFASTYRSGITNNCFVGDNSNIGIAFTGPIGPMTCKLGLSQNDNLITVDDAQWRDVNWTREYSDVHNLHNTSESQERIYIRETGLYQVNCILQTSERPDNLLVRMIDRNSNVIPGAWGSAVGLDQGVPSAVGFSGNFDLDAGEYLRVQILGRFGTTFVGITSISLLDDQTAFTLHKI